MRALLAALLLIAAAPAADASTVTLKADWLDGPIKRLHYVAEWGEVNDVRLSFEDGRLVIRDAVPITFGEGCRAAADDASAVACVPTYGGAVHLRDGDDRFSDTKDILVGSVHGGDGGDVLLSVNAYFLDGGDGDDELETGASVGTYSGGPGDDVMRTPNAGATLDYRDHSEPVTVDLEAGIGGSAGEHDVLTGFRRVVGGPADDVLIGGALPVDLDGGPGNDRISGGGERDRLAGGDGDDVLHGGGGDDNMQGNAGADQLSGGDGDDFMLGDEGADLLDGGAGEDDLWAGGGGDVVRARDGGHDVVDCATQAAPRGFAEADALDLVLGCRSVGREGAAQVFLQKPWLNELDRDGTVRFAAGCSNDQRGGCRLDFALLRRGRRVARRGMTVRAGRLVEPRIAIPANLPRRRRGCWTVKLTLRVRASAEGIAPVVHRFPVTVGSLGVVCPLPSALLFGSSPP